MKIYSDMLQRVLVSLPLLISQLPSMPSITASAFFFHLPQSLTASDLPRRPPLPSPTTAFERVGSRTHVQPTWSRFAKHRHAVAACCGAPHNDSQKEPKHRMWPPNEGLPDFRPEEGGRIVYAGMHAVSAAVASAGKRGDWLQALQLFHTIPNPDITVHHAVLSALQRSGRGAEAQEHLMTMQRR